MSIQPRFPSFYGISTTTIISLIVLSLTAIIYAQTISEPTVEKVESRVTICYNTVRFLYPE